MRNIVINLSRAHERKRSVTKQFRSTGMSCEFFAAIDWQDLTDQQLALVDRNGRVLHGRRELRLGQIACWLSHRKVLEEFLRSGEERIGVFEDDIVFAKDARAVIDCISRTDIPFDIIFLYNGKAADRFVALRKLSSTHHLGIFRFHDHGALGYIITRGGAKKFLSANPKIIHQLDHSMHAYWENDLSVYSLNPPLVITPSAYSYLHEAPAPKRRYSAVSIMRRIRSLAVEEIQRRRAFQRRLLERNLQDDSNGE